MKSFVSLFGNGGARRGFSTWASEWYSAKEGVSSTKNIANQSSFGGRSKAILSDAKLKEIESEVTTYQSHSPKLVDIFKIFKLNEKGINPTSDMENLYSQRFNILYDAICFAKTRNMEVSGSKVTNGVLQDWLINGLKKEEYYPKLKYGVSSGFYISQDIQNIARSIFCDKKAKDLLTSELPEMYGMIGTIAGSSSLSAEQVAKFMDLREKFSKINNSSAVTDSESVITSLKGYLADIEFKPILGTQKSQSGGYTR